MLKHIYTTFIVLISMGVMAQPGAVDLSFDPGTSANDNIQTTAIQADGKILIGGDFTSYRGIAVNRIARLMPDGNLDTTFKIGAGANHRVSSFALQNDGKILVAGDFNYFDTTYSRGLCRLFADGTIDTSLHVDSGFNDRVLCVAIQPDSMILVGGNFTSYNNQVFNRIIRLLPNGTPDPAWDASFGADGSILVIIPQADGKLMIGGDFVHYGGLSNNELNFRIARVNADGTRDSTFVSIPGASRAVTDIAIQSNGDYVVGGNFIQYDWQPRGRLVRLIPDGQRDLNFFIGVGADNGVSGVKLLSNGDMFITGGFANFDNKPAPCLVKLKVNGNIDTTFLVGTEPNNALGKAAIQADGKLIIHGFFTVYNNTPRNRIARLYNCLTTMPGAINGLTTVNCPNTTLTYSINPVQNADSYQWTLPSGWVGSSDSTSITVVSNGTPGTISVKAFSNACGFSYAQTLSILRSTTPAPNICLVTVDSQSTHNIIVWEKQASTFIDSYYIYRETATNVYTKIGSVPYDSLSEYHDYAANPNVTSYRYKLSTIDTCGVESARSPFHSTIHLQNLANGNFQWTFYQIEGQLNPILSFNFYRDAINNGNFFAIGNIPGTNSTYTDITFSSFPDANYVVDANWAISCTPSRAAINTTRSNIKKDKTSIEVGMDEVVLKGDLLVYPNPASTWLNITSKKIQLTSAALVNATGQTIWFEKESKSVFQINTQSLPKGVYAVIAETEKGKATTRVVLN